jgi:hypothetical protein
LPTLKPLLADDKQEDVLPFSRTPSIRCDVLRICGRLRAPQAIPLLLPQLNYPDAAVRTQALQTLYQCGYQVEPSARPQVEEYIQAEVAHAAWTLAGVVDLEGEEAVTLVRSALIESLSQQRVRLFWWLSLLYSVPLIERLRDAFGVAQGSRRQLSAEQRAYLLETIDLSVAKSISKHILPLLDELTPVQQHARLVGDFPQPALDCQQRLHAIFSSDAAWVNTWLRAAALYTAATVASSADNLATWQATTYAAYASPDGLLHETACWALARWGEKSYADKTENGAHDRGQTMLLTIEKVIILKTVDIFANTPDEILVEIAGLLKESTAPAGATIFTQGEPGDSMYIIVEGQVEALDGDQVFTQMGERQVFGEMALLDGEPRTATIRTKQATRLLRLDQEPFYELMDERIEIARGIIQVLLQRLRARTNDVNRLREQLNAQCA